MANRNGPPSAEGERARAVQRLNEVVTERRRLRDQLEPTASISGEVRARASLRAANEQVVARERWLKSVDEREMTS
jgi:hypothetical protein